MLKHNNYGLLRNFEIIQNHQCSVNGNRVGLKGRNPHVCSWYEFLNSSFRFILKVFQQDVQFNISHSSRLYKLL